MIALASAIVFVITSFIFSFGAEIKEVISINWWAPQMFKIFLVPPFLEIYIYIPKNWPIRFVPFLFQNFTHLIPQCTFYIGRNIMDYGIQNWTPASKNLSGYI